MQDPILKISSVAMMVIFGGGGKGELSQGKLGVHTL